MKGRIRSYPFIITAFFIFAAECSTVPREVRQVAADVSFKKLSAPTDEYTHRILILSGCIERIEIQDDRTHLVVLQAPLAELKSHRCFWQIQGSKNEFEIIVTPGFS